MTLEEKLTHLENLIRSYGSVAVAFSGGVDSTFLASVAQRMLDENATAVSAVSSTYPKHEREEAAGFAKRIGIRHVFIESEELDIDGYAENSAERCYFCRPGALQKIRAYADKNDIAFVLDGSNASNASDYRPGSRAVKELTIATPLAAAGLTKDDIRELSQRAGLPSWNKPSFACLGSRFPYGERITREKVGQVEAGEEFLRSLGFRQFRIRHHGTIARIEVPVDDIAGTVAHRDEIVKQLTALGFLYVTVDLAGYRTGSMNLALSRSVREPDPGMNAVYRIIDANVNRLREALRVVEDVLRFEDGDAAAFCRIKEQRHLIRRIIDGIEAELLAARDSTADVGEPTLSANEHARADDRDILRANFIRAQESSRVLEETLKTVDAARSETAKSIRFQLYTIEKDVMLPRYRNDR